MPSKILTLQGSFVAQPQNTPSGLIVPVIPLAETQGFQKTISGEILVDTDAVFSVSFGNLSQAHFAYLKLIGGEVRVRVSSTYGALQAFPVNTLWWLFCLNNPVTSLDVARIPGSNIPVSVEFFLAEK